MKTGVQPLAASGENALKAISVKVSLTPGKVWRGSVAVGYDNEVVLGKVLGLSAQQIAELKDNGVI